MGLLSDIKEQQAGKTVANKCLVWNLCEALDDVDANDLREALDDSTLTATVIADVLNERDWGKHVSGTPGYQIQAQALRYHRRKNCACWRYTGKQ